jgi:Resolvase, N terminal domain
MRLPHPGRQSGERSVGFNCAQPLPSSPVVIFAAISGGLGRSEVVVSDPGVSGADPIEVRPGFSALLDRIEGNGVHTVIVEDASRFVRELVTQELGIIALIKRGVRVLTASGDDLTDSSDPSRKMMRQIAGSFAEIRKGSPGRQASCCSSTKARDGRQV